MADSVILQTVLNFVQGYQAQFQRSRAFCAHMQELGLLEPMRVTFAPPNGERRNHNFGPLLKRIGATRDAEVKAEGDGAPVLH